MTAFSNYLVVAILLSTVAGCGNGNLVSVSGTVTHDGQPVEDVLVIFSPEVQGENHFPGPISMGKTDANGKYSLKAKGGANGAVVGTHAVGFNWADVSSMEVSALQGEFAAAAGAGASKEELDKVKTRISETKEKIQSRPQGISTINETFEVPAGGTSEANFDLAR